MCKLTFTADTDDWHLITTDIYPHFLTLFAEEQQTEMAFCAIRLLNEVKLMVRGVK